MSLIQTPWTSQPQQFVPQSGTELMRGAYVWTPHNPRQLVGSRIVQATGETAYNSSPVGDKGIARKWSRSANAGIDFGTTQIITQNSGVTVLVVANPTSAATMKVPFSQRAAGGTFTQTDFVFNSSSIDSLAASAGTVVLTTYHNASGGVKADSQIDGKTHCWVAGNGTANGYIFRDGVKQTLATSTRISTFTSSTQKLRVGNMADDASTTYPCDDPVYLVVVWDRLLSEAEARSVSENPWQVFQPLPRRIFAQVAAGDPTLYPSLYANENSFYAHTVSVGDVTITPSLFSNSNTFHSATVTLGGSTQTLTPSLYSNANTFYGPSVSPGAVALTPALFSNTNSFFGAVVTLDSDKILSPSLVSNSNSFYGPTVSVGAVSLLPSLFVNSNTFYNHVVGGALTDSEKIDLILDILSNRQTLDATTGIYTLYADDGVTVLKTAQAWEDSEGTQPYRGRGLKRLDALQ